MVISGSSRLLHTDCAIALVAVRLQMNEEDRFSAVQRAPVSDAKPLKGAAPIPVAANGSRTSAWSIPGSGATIVSGGR